LEVYCAEMWKTQRSQLWVSRHLASLHSLCQGDWWKRIRHQKCISTLIAQLPMNKLMVPINKCKLPINRHWLPRSQSAGNTSTRPPNFQCVALPWELDTETFPLTSLATAHNTVTKRHGHPKQDDTTRWHLWQASLVHRHCLWVWAWFATRQPHFFRQRWNNYVWRLGPIWPCVCTLVANWIPPVKMQAHLVRKWHWQVNKSVHWTGTSRSFKLPTIKFGRKL